MEFFFQREFKELKDVMNRKEGVQNLIIEKRKCKWFYEREIKRHDQYKMNCEGFKRKIILVSKNTQELITLGAKRMIVSLFSGKC